MIEPGSGDRRAARRRARSSWAASPKRWKNADTWITDMCPLRGVREVKD
jgi:hypothetical protein